MKTFDHAPSAHASGNSNSTPPIQPPSPPVDPPTAQRFLDGLERDGHFCFQTFWDDEAGKKRLRELERREAELTAEERAELNRLACRERALTRQAYGTLGECVGMLSALNANGAGVFVTVNVTDGVGRTAANVTGLRALFVDGDGIPLPTVWPIRPNIVVQRDATHWHAYFYLVTGEPLDAFREAQRQLIRYYGSDDKIHDLPRVMRLPGFLHRKGTPVPVRLTHCVSEPRRTIQEVLAAHPLKAPPPHPSPPTDATAESSAKKGQKRKGAKKKEGEEDTVPEFDPSWLEEGPPPRDKLEQARQKDPKIGALLDGRANWLRDQSGSGRDMALAVRLARQGWTPNDIYRVLRWWPHGSTSEAAKNGGRYFRRTLEHAVAAGRSATLDDLTDLQVLGENAKGDVVLFNPGTRTLREFKIAQFRYEDLLQIAGEQAAHLVAGASSIPHRVMHDGFDIWQAEFQSLREEIAVLAGKTKLGHLEEIGNGIWPLDDCLLLVGDDVVVLRPDGSVELVTSPAYRGRYIRRDPCRAMLPVRDLLRRMQMMDAARTRAAVVKLAQMLGQWALRNPTDAWLLTGLALATPYQAVWAWRSQVWCTGPTNAAKSLLFAFLRRVLGPTTRLVEGKTSEAGLRQDAGVNSESRLLDEFDSITGYARQGILELARSAGPGGWIVKGTPGHVPVRFRVFFMLWFASIEVPLERAADANRFIVVEMDELKHHIEAPDAAGVEDLGLDLLAALLKFAPRARALEARLSAVPVAGMQGRLVRNMAVPAAVVGALLGLSDQGAERLMRYWLRVHGRDEVVPQVPDEARLLQAIMSSQVDDNLGHTSTVGAQVERNANGLHPYGIREMPDHSGLFMDPDAVRRHLLRGTNWADMNIRSVLARLAGAKAGQQRLGGVSARGLVIPWAVLGGGPLWQPPPSPMSGRFGAANTGSVSAAAGAEANSARR